jgi:hypothetical protein
MPELLSAEDGQQHSPAALIYAALLHNKLPVEDGFFNFDAVSLACTFAIQHSHAQLVTAPLQQKPRRPSELGSFNAR